jgi:hypothetical protein
MKRSFSSLVGSPAFLWFIGVFVLVTMLIGSDFTPSMASREIRWRNRQDNLRIWFSWGLKPADTVSYAQGARKWDSIQKLIHNQDQLNYDKEGYGGGDRFNPFLLYETRECERCYEHPQVQSNGYESDDMTTRYFIGLAGYRLADMRYYFRDNNTNFIIPSTRESTPSNDSLLKRFRFYDRIAAMRFENMYSVPFRYDYWNEIMLIPVDKKTYSTFGIIYSVFTLMVLVYVFILTFIIPFRIISNIALGKAFHIKTIKLVDFLAYNFLLYPFVVFIYRCIVHLLASKYITPDLKFTGLSELMRSGLIVYIGLLLLALGVALKKGYKLQQEQDLTI